MGIKGMLTENFQVNNVVKYLQMTRKHRKSSQPISKLRNEMICKEVEDIGNGGNGVMAVRGRP